MRHPDITFCVPVFNVCEYLADCINSILEEIKDIDAEIICVDDCSTDDSWQILNDICSQNSNCLCYRNDSNRGVSYSRNRALEVAKGKYIWFVDSDDLLCPGAVKKFLENAEKENADVILGNYSRVEEAFSLKGYCDIRTEDITFIETENVAIPMDNSGKTMWAIWAGMFRTDFLRKNGLLFRENMIAQEDTLFYYELEQKYPKIIKTNAICYLYRQRNVSVMHQKSEIRMQKYYQSMRIMLDVYNGYLEAGTYRDKNVLQSKIHRSYENVFSCLAQCTDKKFVKENFRQLKQLGYYPYPLRRAALKNKGSKIKAFLDFLLPIEVCFWCVHYIYSMINKKRFADYKTKLQ